MEAELILPKIASIALYVYGSLPILLSTIYLSTTLLTYVV